MAVNIVIIGAGDHGRGTLEIVKASNAVAPRFDVLGYLDDHPAKQGLRLDGVPVLGGLDWIGANHHPDLRYVLAIADCAAKRRLADRLEIFRPEYQTLVHPSAVVSSGVDLGRGTLIGAGVVVAFDTTIGDHVTVNLNSTVGHDCTVGRFVTIAPGANVAGRVRLGEGCDIGLNAAVGKGVTVGDWSNVGPGCVLLKDLQANRRVFGNPARVVAPTEGGTL